MARIAFIVQEGYEKWAESYDDDGNALIRLEEQTTGGTQATNGAACRLWYRALRDPIRGVGL